MTQVKFYRVETLPEVGEVGSLYFVYGSGGVQSLLYICVGTGLFELYTPDLYELENKMDSLEDKVEAESQTIQHKIDNIKLPEIDLSSVAKEETNESILSALNGIASTMYKGVPIVSQTTDATIAPNVWNVWGEVAALTITKGAEVSGVVNSYLIRFAAAEGCAITFDGFTLQWYGGSVPTWNAGSTYEINIVDNLALWAEFAAA